jgi:diacylglycerol kinase (ATP)
MLKYKIIINPSAGKGAALKSVPTIEHRLNALKLNYDIVLTERPGHAVDLAYQAVKDKYDVVVSGGGDGTSNEVINGLMRARQEGSDQVTMGILAIGRGNDFAYSMGVPTGLDEGCESLSKAEGRLIDIGCVKGGLYPQGRYFGNGVGIGFDTVVGFEAAKLRHLSGMLGYVVGTFKTMFLYFNAPELEVSWEGKKIVQPCLMVSIMNGRRMGGTFFMAPQGKADDGVLDLIIVGQLSRMGILMMIPHFMKGTQAGQPGIQTFQTSNICVKALKGSIPAHADGETLCTEGEQLSIELLPRQIKLICRIV